MIEEMLEKEINDYRILSNQRKKEVDNDIELLWLEMSKRYSDICNKDKEYIKNIEDIIEEPQEARARKGDIKDGKIFVDEVNGWVPLEVPEEIREHYDSYLILGLIDEHGNYIYNKDEDED